MTVDEQHRQVHAPARPGQSDHAVGLAVQLVGQLLDPLERDPLMAQDSPLVARLIVGVEGETVQAP